jgi:hypothetical protein
VAHWEQVAEWQILVFSPDMGENTEFFELGKIQKRKILVKMPKSGQNTEKNLFEKFLERKN